MYMDDPFTWSADVRQASFRWPWGHVPYRRRLAAIERDLTEEEPVLIAKFAVFNQLADGERPAGAERVPRPAWSGPARLAAFLFLAATVALGLALSVQLDSVTRLCPAAAATTSGHLPPHPAPPRMPYC